MVTTDYTWMHEATGNNPRAWLATVETLRHAAAMIRKPTPVTPPPPAKNALMLATDGVYAMLLGYAFECALKGIWVQQGHKIVSSGKARRVDGVGDHELLPLARKVGIHAESDELDVLNRLTPFIRFAGRYPVPIRPQEMKPRKVVAGGDVSPVFFSDRDFSVAERLLNRVTTQLQRAVWP